MKGLFDFFTSALAKASRRPILSFQFLPQVVFVLMCMDLKCLRSN